MLHNHNNYYKKAFKDGIMVSKIQLSRINQIRLILIPVGIISLIISFLCFFYVIPGFEICGSACEYWWSWIIDFPPQGICILMCVARNWLYKPLFLIGVISIGITLVIEIFRVLKNR